MSHVRQMERANHLTAQWCCVSHFHPVHCAPPSTAPPVSWSSTLVEIHMLHFEILIISYLQAPLISWSARLAKSYRSLQTPFLAQLWLCYSMWTLSSDLFFLSFLVILWSCCLLACPPDLPCSSVLTFVLFPNPITWCVLQPSPALWPWLPVYFLIRLLCFWPGIGKEFVWSVFCCGPTLPN